MIMKYLHWNLGRNRLQFRSCLYECNDAMKYNYRNMPKIFDWVTFIKFKKFRNVVDTFGDALGNFRLYVIWHFPSVEFHHKCRIHSTLCNVPGKILLITAEDKYSSMGKTFFVELNKNIEISNTIMFKMRVNACSSFEIVLNRAILRMLLQHPLQYIWFTSFFSSELVRTLLYSKRVHLYHIFLPYH